jgi:hypothetical protein
VGQYLIILAILAAVVLFVSAPVRRVVARAQASAGGADADLESELADLEAAREAKYRELRDADLDHRTGKLSDEDYATLDRSLRGEAIEILRGLDREHERTDPPEDS